MRLVESEQGVRMRVETQVDLDLLHYSLSSFVIAHHHPAVVRLVSRAKRQEHRATAQLGAWLAETSWSRRRLDESTAQPLVELGSEMAKIALLCVQVYADELRVQLFSSTGDELYPMECQRFAAALNLLEEHSQRCPAAPEGLSGWDCSGDIAERETKT
jgi:hypothetical protein